MTNRQLKRVLDRAAPALDELYGREDSVELPETFVCRVMERLPVGKPVGLARAAACLLLALVLAGSSLLALSPQVRAAVVGWLAREVPGGAGYQYQGSESDAHIPNYCLGYIPAGFTAANPIRNGGSVNQSFFGPAGRGRFLAVKCNGDYPYALYLDTEGAEPMVEQVRLGKCIAEYYTVPDGRSAALVWHSEDGSVLFCITGPFHKRTMVRMAESVYVAQKEGRVS